MVSERPSVEALGPVSAGVVVWTRAGEAHVTVVAKQRARLAPEGEAHGHEPAPLALTERTLEGRPTASVDEPCDLVPTLPRAEVLVRGSAFAPGGVPTRALSVRLGLARGSTMVLDKLLEVVRVEPFVELPLTWERAYGGLGFADNPVGVGHGEARLPDVRGPRHGEPAGLGPLSLLWGASSRLLGGAPRPKLGQPVVALAELIDLAYFQASPRDQQVGALEGDEWLLLQHLHPAHPLLRARLAVSRVSARLSTHAEPLSLALARVLVRPSELSVDLTLRATARLASLEAARGLSVMVDATSGEPGAVGRAEPARGVPTPRTSALRSERHDAAEGASLRATQALDVRSLAAALPFEARGPSVEATTVGAPTIGAPNVGAPNVGAPSVGAQPIGAPNVGAPTGGAGAGVETPWAAAARAPRPRSAPLGKETAWLDEPAAPSGSAPAVAALEPGSRRPARGGALAGTRLLGDEEHAAAQGKASVPFAGAPEASPRSGPPSGEVPGAPWSQEPSVAPPRPRSSFAGTAELEPAPRPPDAGPAEATAAPAGDEPARAPVDPSVFFRRDEAPAPAAPPAQRPPVKPPRPSMKGAVYGTFKKK